MFGKTARGTLRVIIEQAQEVLRLVSSRKEQAPNVLQLDEAREAVCRQRVGKSVENVPQYSTFESASAMKQKAWSRSINYTLSCHDKTYIGITRRNRFASAIPSKRFQQPIFVPFRVRNPNLFGKVNGISCALPWYKMYQEAPVTAQVSLRTGMYISLLGFVVLCFPGHVSKLIVSTQSTAAMNAPSTGWIQVGGMLASLFGFYYLGAAWDDCEGRKPTRFYQATVMGRLLLCIGFSSLVTLQKVNSWLLLLAAINLISAASLWRSLML